MRHFHFRHNIRLVCASIRVSIGASIGLVALAVSPPLSAANPVATSPATNSPAQPTSIDPVLEQYLQARSEEFDQIESERKQELASLAQQICVDRSSDRPVRLNFICTHNSRRSHLAQIWTAVAAHHFGIDHVQTFSGGTEATAMNERIVAALRRSGLKVDGDRGDEQPNPHYTVGFAKVAGTLECFSKVYNEPPNPSEAFVAVLVCGNADKNCPVVHGSTHRLVIRYDDPKVSDNTPEESLTYDRRCAQISREMLYAMSLVQ